jgi:hypothetical protein
MTISISLQRIGASPKSFAVFPKAIGVSAQPISLSSKSFGISPQLIGSLSLVIGVP